MSVKFGLDAKLYYCVAGIGGAPTWTELSNVKNVTLNLQTDELLNELRRKALEDEQANGKADQTGMGGDAEPPAKGG